MCQSGPGREGRLENDDEENRAQASRTDQQTGGDPIIRKDLLMSRPPRRQPVAGIRCTCRELPRRLRGSSSERDHITRNPVRRPQIVSEMSNAETRREESRGINQHLCTINRGCRIYSRKITIARISQSSRAISSCHSVRHCLSALSAQGVPPQGT